jgi:quercetin dioxygenase-like cupin family protein
MTRMTQKLTVVGAFVAGALVACAAGGIGPRLAQATPPSNPGFTPTPLAGAVLKQDINTWAETDDWEIELKTKGESDVFFTHIKLAPGAHGGWHSHPGPSIIAVKSGTATFYDDCDDFTRRQYPAGTGFVEDADCVHLLANEGTEDLVVVVMQIVELGAPRRIDQPAP